MIEGFLSKSSASLINYGISMCYISNEWHCFTLCMDICYSRNKYEIENLHIIMYFFGLYFLIVHISTDIVLTNLKSPVVVGGIHVEGTVSQNLVLSLKPIFHCDAKKLRWALALA